ncbi:MAG: pantoate--beta-alanine ligase [Gammaproteobacteria bacterium]|mgnify:FL=1
MKIITSIKDQIDYCNSLAKKSENISLIPTMGNLHKGHESLLFQPNLIKNKKIVSLFVNPLQFNNSDDYKSYPKSIDSDIKILEKNKVDCLFMPSEDEILKDINELESFDLPEYMNILCGKYRDGHFLGVFKIVKKLFEIIKPSIAYFGKKDYQQLMMIKYISKKYFNNQISIISCDTIRENSGLAMSSRNNKLTLSQRDIASFVYRELISLKESIRINSNYNYAELQKKSIDSLSVMGIKVEYLELLSSDGFSIKQKNSTDNLMLFVAFYISGVRLIDNIEV